MGNVTHLDENKAGRGDGIEKGISKSRWEAKCRKCIDQKSQLRALQGKSRNTRIHE